MERKFEELKRPPAKSRTVIKRSIVRNTEDPTPSATVTRNFTRAHTSNDLSVATDIQK
jgi:hypothetical protein